MTDRNQDDVYMSQEGDAFFRRNIPADTDPMRLRDRKRELHGLISRAGCPRPRRVLEYGCNYGDLLHHYVTEGGAEAAVGIEVSAEAVKLGQDAYGDKVKLLHGSMGSNAIADDPAYEGYFDLVIIDDVFCWVSRQTLFQSIANVDRALAEGGFLFIREFLPGTSVRNRNHHVADSEVWCHKPRDTHARMFTASAVYEPVWRQVFLDGDDAWAAAQGGRFESRWQDSLLRKSYGDYYLSATR